MAGSLQPRKLQPTQERRKICVANQSSDSSYSQWL